MTGKFIPLFGSGFGWRFLEEENANLKPNAADLEKIRPLAESNASERWKQWISASAHHYMLVEAVDPGASELLCDACGWGDPKKESELRALLKNELRLKPESVITFFWSETHAAETEWGMFLKYWPVFCYRSDDSNVVVLHESSKAIVYVEDNLWIVDRKRYFGQS